MFSVFWHVDCITIQTVKGNPKMEFLHLLQKTQMEGNMKNKRFRNTLIIMTVIAVFGAGTYAFADRGTGCPKWGGQGSDLSDNNSRGRGYHSWNTLTDAEKQKLQEAQEKFRNDTDELRQDIFAKQMMLKSELAQKDPDTKRALGLQKELSELKAQFDEKRLMHLLALKDINPKLGNHFSGKARGPGNGPRGGGGHCWQ